MSLSISIFGLGYVGSVTAACFAHMGHQVIGVDVSHAKVDMISGGHSPIIDVGMEELVAEVHKAGRLTATSDPEAAVRDSEISFVCVGTPGLRNGKLDTSHIERVAEQIGRALACKKSHHLVVFRSTVLPGTTESHVIPILERASGRKAGPDFTVCYNPEFMREGSAVNDFLQPPYIILGAAAHTQIAPLRELYQDMPGPLFETSIAVAEMVKYVCNAFHALKVGFANEIGTLCKHLNVDSEVVTKIFTSDARLNISAAYLSPGFAFGGSCLPKDVRALTYRAKELDLDLPLLDSLLLSNEQHISRALEAVLRTKKRKVGMLGLSFKAGTDDLRESPQVQLVKRLLGEGCTVQVWDQDVSLGRLAGSNRQYIEEVIPHIGSLLSADLEQVMRSAEVVIIGTRAVSKDQIEGFLTSQHIVIDLMNLGSEHRPTRAASYQGICW